MNLHARLNAIDHQRARRCVACGGALGPSGPSLPRTWRGIVAAFQQLPDEERIGFFAHLGRMDLLSARHQELAHRMYCTQQGLAYEHTTAPYSSPDPPPAPWFPDA